MKKKIGNLEDVLKKLKKVVIAFSGGVDSTFLLKFAVETLGEKNVLPVICISPVFPKEEIKKAEKISEEIGIKLLKIKTNQMKDRKFISNPPDRCFYCKRIMLTEIEKIRKKYGFNKIVDGANKDDENDYRPGEKAKGEFGVVSPLKEAGIGKKEIREYSKKMGLSIWDKPSFSCLATRISYGEKITEEKLKKIEEGENILKKLGFKVVRLRCYSEKFVRIEVGKEGIKKVFIKRKEIVNQLKKLGFKHITVDLEGYKTRTRSSEDGS